MKILNCGAEMQSTSLALISCEQKDNGILHGFVDWSNILLPDTRKRKKKS